MLKPTFAEDDREHGEQIKYWNCPVRYVPRCVWEWVGQYRYSKTFGAPVPPVEELGPRWYRAWLLYEECLQQGIEHGRRNH